ncbi:hypothetical protein NP233_g297 [Leucocoprinus birnbaumii]|uniref:Uncharacterized protein n=1 Tax=Leucocoprinus birnbaumii TaxID=56174 RepID=A0AAD5W2M5_9AGAR|nr:hypothetical protein NP233_g297 [Leucocoprinus birnbaumii]
MSSSTDTGGGEAEGLLFVLGECEPAVSINDFNDWYDNEHAPARLTVPGISTAIRYKSNDSQTPSWLAIYDLSSPSITKSPPYLALRDSASANEKSLIPRLPILQRRIYSLINSRTSPDLSSSLPGQYVLVIFWSVPKELDEEIHKWYDEEHTTEISKSPGLATRKKIQTSRRSRPLRFPRLRVSDNSNRGLTVVEFTSTVRGSCIHFHEPDKIILSFDDCQNHLSGRVSAASLSNSQLNPHLFHASMSTTNVMSSQPQPDPQGQSLILTFTQCKPGVSTSEFNAWYDSQEAKISDSVTPKVMTARRFRATDGETPEWLSIADVNSPTPDLIQIRDTLDDTGSSITASRILAHCRYTYTILRERVDKPTALPASYVLIAGWTIPAHLEDEFNDWYDEEHMGDVARVPGFIRGRRYKLHASDSLRPGPGPFAYNHVIVFEWEDDKYWDYIINAKSSPRTEKMIKDSEGVETRRFELVQNLV